MRMRAGLYRSGTGRRDLSSHKLILIWRCFVGLCVALPLPPGLLKGRYYRVAPSIRIVPQLVYSAKFSLSSKPTQQQGSACKPREKPSLGTPGGPPSFQIRHQSPLMFSAKSTQGTAAAGGSAGGVPSFNARTASATGTQCRVGAFKVRTPEE